MDTAMQFVSIFGAIIGLLGGLGGAVFFLRYTATKANLEGKDETIETLSKSRDEWRTRALDSENLIAGLTAENKTLREIATQTPEILTLTKAVTQLTKTVEKGQKQLAEFFASKV